MPGTKELPLWISSVVDSLGVVLLVGVVGLGVCSLLKGSAILLVTSNLKNNQK